MGDINLIELLIYLLNFAVTFVLLYLLLYRPVSKFLAARKERVAAALQEAEAIQKEAEAVLQEAQTELANSGENARKISHEAIEAAALDAEKILDNAQEEAEAIIARTREQVKVEWQAVQERALTELVSLSGNLASRILAREVTLADNRDIVEQFFAEDLMQVKESYAAKAAAKEENRP